LQSPCIDLKRKRNRRILLESKLKDCTSAERSFPVPGKWKSSTGSNFLRVQEVSPNVSSLIPSAKNNQVQLSELSLTYFMYLELK
jgi:hypothetical protein